MQGGEEVAIVLLEEQILVKTCAYRKVNYKYFVSSQYTERIQKHLSFNTKILTNSFSIFDYYSKRPTEIKIRILKMQMFNFLKSFPFSSFSKQKCPSRTRIHMGQIMIPSTTGNLFMLQLHATPGIPWKTVRLLGFLCGKRENWV